MWFDIHNDSCPVSAMRAEDNSTTLEDNSSSPCTCGSYSFAQYCREFDEICSFDEHQTNLFQSPFVPTTPKSIVETFGRLLGPTVKEAKEANDEAELIEKETDHISGPNKNDADHIAAASVKEADRIALPSVAPGVKEADRIVKPSATSVKEADRIALPSVAPSVKEADRIAEPSEVPGVKEADRIAEPSEAPGVKEADHIAAPSAASVKEAHRISGPSVKEAGHIVIPSEKQTFVVSSSQYLAYASNIYMSVVRPQKYESESSRHWYEQQQQQLYMITRKMMYTMLGCNKLYGHDGFTYDSAGIPIGEEYLAVNRLVEEGIISCVYLSDFKKLVV